MKPALPALLALMFFLKADAQGGDPPSPSGDAKEILRLETLLNESWLKRDVATISSIVADDFQSWSFKGARLTKGDLLRAVEKSAESDTRVEDPNVRVYGDAAVYTARIIDSGKCANGEAFTVKTCITAVYVRSGGKWRLVASQEMLVPGSA